MSEFFMSPDKVAKRIAWLELRGDGGYALYCEWHDWLAGQTPLKRQDAFLSAFIRGMHHWFTAYGRPPQFSQSTGEVNAA